MVITVSVTQLRWWWWWWWW